MLVLLPRSVPAHERLREHDLAVVRLRVGLVALLAIAAPAQRRHGGWGRRAPRRFVVIAERAVTGHLVQFAEAVSRREAAHRSFAVRDVV